MARKISELKAQVRDSLVHILIEKYQREPMVIEKELPEVAQILKAQISSSIKKNDWEIFKLTKQEEKERWSSSNERVNKLGNDKAPLSKEEAVSALEDAASLIEGSFKNLIEMNQENLIKLIKIATGFSLSRTGKAKRWVIREELPARSISIMLGVKVNLTWDKKMVSIEINPKELKSRDKALKFVGIGEDKTTDTAERHDDYLAVVLQNV